MIVRDDGSSDSTLQIVEQYRSRYSDRVIVRKNLSRQGACRTFSLLAEESAAPYVAFCDQDDIWRADKLELGYAAAKQVEAEHGVHTPVLVFSDMELIGEDGKSTGTLDVEDETREPSSSNARLDAGSEPRQRMHSPRESQSPSHWDSNTCRGTHARFLVGTGGGGLRCSSSFR